MNVRELMEKLQSANPDMPVVVDCENRCDPHPVEVVLVRGPEENEDFISFPHVLIYADSGVDFTTREYKE